VNERGRIQGDANRGGIHGAFGADNRAMVQFTLMSAKTSEIFVLINYSVNHYICNRLEKKM